MINPNPRTHLENLLLKLKSKESFSFIRFSDGEIEILRNRYLEINNGKTVFRDREFSNNFPVYDKKKFDPEINQDFREDLLKSALFRGGNYYKGIPTAHNDALYDRELMLRLNGGFDSRMTFADLFLNSNYETYKKKFVKEYKNYRDIFLIANYRVKPVDFLKKAKHIAIPDNFFSEYNKTLNHVLSNLDDVKSGSLILSSASSLSNIVAYKVRSKKITFIDVGTSINNLLSLNNSIREYHGSDSFIKNFFYRRSKRFHIKW